MGCVMELAGLVLMSLALFISMCLNVIFCVRRRHVLCRDCCYPKSHEGESPSQDEGHHFHNLNHHEQQVNPQNHRDEQEENPIYGNISTDRQGSVEGCYETMTKQNPTFHMKSSDPDLNYASLDLKKAKKHKKPRHQQGNAQGRGKFQEAPADHLTSPANSFLEVEADVDAQLPSRDTSTMVSHSSIYLNSQQIVQEAEEMERERGVNVERANGGWEGVGGRGSGGEWGANQESGERADRLGGSEQLLELEAIQTGTDHFPSGYGHDGVRQD